MTVIARPELVRHLAEDFTALQDAVLDRMNGTASREILAALDHPALTGGAVAALAHADVLARGAVRRGELSGLPAQRLRPLREYARRVRRARSQADAVWKEHRARRVTGRQRPPTDPLEARIVRTAYSAAYFAALSEELAERGLSMGLLGPEKHDRARWAREHGLMPAAIPAPVRELLACDDDTFVQALLDDARRAENPHLGQDALAERWSRHSRASLAWGRYAIAQAERAALTRPVAARAVHLDALDDAHQDAAILTARAVEAAQRTAELHDRIAEFTAAGPFADLVAACHAGALTRFGSRHPELWLRAGQLSAEHRTDCAERDAGCPRCHSALADVLGEEASGLTPREGSDGEEEAVSPLTGDRYALLDDLDPHAVVAVADAAVGDESALCGYGWVAENGVTGHGDSMASSSGEAEVIGICAAALGLLDGTADAPVVVLCDSTEAVSVVDRALAAADPAAAHRTVLFPEGRRLLAELLPHRDRVEVRWLKGHIGHDLNETADALASLALRRVTGRVPASVAHKEHARLLRTLTPTPTPEGRQ
ncbi:hypothetical protein OIB37_30005 [Streptomyces sp. NBC_00820]|uniref:RNase H family protein n=1 Tax=Streptomyces sp. NBC_00820 TaxID=2975842 RepID=UPI002ED35512|nr:hypothetical protein OIB37_30005 [Streptomyces sp. NBC_00820]